MVNNVRSSVVPRLFLACFFVNSSWGRKVLDIFFRGDDIFIQTKDTRLRKEEEERRKKSERTSFERERERSVVFSYIYLSL